MKAIQLITTGFTIALLLGFYAGTFSSDPNINNTSPVYKLVTKHGKIMKLGAFSISLSVKDLKASKQFYEALGFTLLAGGMDKNYLIMKNENALIGLFQGMFENNILTFNPGWDENGKNTGNFDDIREIQSRLKSNGITIDPEIDIKTTGPASLMITDPDGNVILFDQHR